MKSYKVIQLEPAINDVENIALYIANDLKNPAAAERFFDRVDNALSGLAYLPFRYSNTFFKYDGEEIRMKPFDSYSIVYTIFDNEKKVYVLGILNYRQDLQRFFDNRNTEVEKMEIRETVFDYDCNQGQEIKVNDSEIPQYLKEMLDKGLEAMREGRGMEHKEAMKMIRMRLGFDEN